MYGIADLDNCYVSCERVFRPDLKGVPVVVLSNKNPTTRWKDIIKLS